VEVNSRLEPHASRRMVRPLLAPSTMEMLALRPLFSLISSYLKGPQIQKGKKGKKDCNFFFKKEKITSKISNFLE
jgi:hypothetical protein